MIRNGGGWQPDMGSGKGESLPQGELPTPALLHKPSRNTRLANRMRKKNNPDFLLPKLQNFPLWLTSYHGPPVDQETQTCCYSVSGSSPVLYPALLWWLHTDSSLKRTGGKIG